MIRFEKIRKSFGPLEVIQGLDAEVRRGKVTAVIGPNGAGKTTLIKMVLGLVRPDDGDIILDEERVNSHWSYRDKIGYMPQIVRLPENLSGNELAEMLTDLRKFTDGPDDELVDAFHIRKDMDRPFKVLSGGTRQKVNAALAFRFKAELMILDEPTAGLDPVSSRVLKEKVRRERDLGRTFLVTSHDMGHLEAIADDIVFLLEGRAAYLGSLERLKELTGENDLEGAIAAMMLGRTGVEGSAGPSAEPGWPAAAFSSVEEEL